MNETEDQEKEAAKDEINRLVLIEEGGFRVFCKSDENGELTASAAALVNSLTPPKPQQEEPESK